MANEMRRLAIIGDVHDNRARLAATLALLAGREYDVVLLAGDVGLDPPWREPARHAERAAHDASIAGVIDAVARQLAAPVVWVPGNHDLPDAVSIAEAENADGRRVEAGGLALVGLGGAGPDRFGFPYEWDECDAAARLAGLGDERPDVFLCHTPPRGCRLDRTASGEHVGSAAVRQALAQLRPGFFVCGHIHEAFGLELVEGVPCLNAGSLGEPYGRVLGWEVGWADGRPRVVRSWTVSGGRAVARDFPS